MPGVIRLADPAAPQRQRRSSKKRKNREEKKHGKHFMNIKSEGGKAPVLMVNCSTQLHMKWYIQATVL